MEKELEECWRKILTFTSQKLWRKHRKNLDRNLRQDPAEYTSVNIKNLNFALRKDQNVLGDVERELKNFSNGNGKENILHIFAKRNLSKATTIILENI